MANPNPQPGIGNRHLLLLPKGKYFTKFSPSCWVLRAIDREQPFYGESTRLVLSNMCWNMNRLGFHGSSPSCRFNNLAVCWKVTNMKIAKNKRNYVHKRIKNVPLLRGIPEASWTWWTLVNWFITWGLHVRHQNELPENDTTINLKNRMSFYELSTKE